MLKVMPAMGRVDTPVALVPAGTAIVRSVVGAVGLPPVGGR